jgi:hypothetical protein
VVGSTWSLGSVPSGVGAGAAHDRSSPPDAVRDASSGFF